MALAVVLLAGCGGEDFKNEARAPIRLELSGVIQDDEVTVSPSKIGAGPVAITISNQTDVPHSITLEGSSTIDRAGPIETGDDLIEWVESAQGIGLGLAQRKR